MSTGAIPTPLRVGTRASALATTQTGMVVAALQEAGFAIEVLTVTTQGDVRGDVPIARFGRDGVFVRELEEALRDGRIDLAVHSLKDLPTTPAPGLEVAAVPIRESPFDALVGRTATTLAALPPGAIVGTSSVRRICQLRLARPDLVVRPLRGNVDTRLRKLDAGEYDALILAAAGLRRLGLGGRITEELRPDVFWPAVAQGALGLQIRSGDVALREALAAVDDPATHRAVRAERACLAALAGGCLAPIAAWARDDSERGLVLGGCVLEDEGPQIRRVVAEERIPQGGDPDSLGRGVAERLRDQGADAMLERSRRASGPLV